MVERRFGQPSRWTFTIHPIRQLLAQEMGSGLFIQGNWADPFAGLNSPAMMRNDLNPKMPAESHMDALEFCRSLETASYDGVLYDPPYSLNQAREVYSNFGGQRFNPGKMEYWSGCKDELARALKPGGKAICFGWNSMGLGKSRGFEMTRVLLVPHGGSRNDTIVTVEVKAAAPNLQY